MTTHEQLMELYGKSPEEYNQLKTCSIDGCKETNCSFIDSTDALDVQFYCMNHWRDIDNLERAEKVARDT